MAEEGRFFDAVGGDRTYTAADIAATVDAVLGGVNGVVRNYEGGLEVSLTGGSGLSVASGAAFIEGYSYENTSAKALAASENAAGSARIDLVVTQLDLTARTIETVIHLGAAGAGQPSPTVTSSVIEIPLAAFTV